MLEIGGGSAGALGGGGRLPAAVGAPLCWTVVLLQGTAGRATADHAMLDLGPLVAVCALQTSCRRADARLGEYLLCFFLEIGNRISLHAVSLHHFYQDRH